MFSITHIWKKSLGGVIFVALAGLVFNLVALSLPAHAAGEVYNWTDTTYTGITATGGGYSGTVTFTRSATPSGGATFTSTAAYICNKVVTTAPLTLKIDATNFASGTPAVPTQVSINGPPTVVCAGLDAQPVINAPKGVDPITGTTTVITAPECDQGSFSWLACPLVDNLTRGISSLAASALTPFLQVNVISPATAPQLYAVWASMRNVADAFFILIFFVVIFSTMTGQDFGKLDQYTVKKIWPYLIAAAILVQFSFLLCGFLVDIGNVAGAGINTLLTSIIHPSSGPATGGNVAANLGAAGLAGLLGGGAVLVLASSAAAVPLLLSLLISLFVVFLTLGLRFLLIAVLIAAAPLACIALVLPNTRHWFNDWFTFLFRLILMYPIIIGIINIAGIINQVLPFSASTTTNGAASFAVILMKVILVIVTFLIIPMTFRFAGKGLERAYGFMNGTATRGKSALKSSEMWARGKEERDARKAGYMGRFLNSKSITSLQSKGPVRRGLATAGGFVAGTALLNAPKDKPALKKLQSRLAGGYKKALDDMDEATPPNMLKLMSALNEPNDAKRNKAIRELRADAPNLLNMASNPSGRIAISKRMAELELHSPTTIQNFATTGQRRNWASVSYGMSQEYPALLSSAGKQYSGNPAILARIVKPMSDHKVEDSVGNPVDYFDAAGKNWGSQISREVGDVDLAGLARGIRKITPSTFGDKHTVGNFLVMTTTGNDQLDKAAHDVAMEYALNMDKTTVEKVFDPDNPRTFAMREARLQWIKGMQAQYETVMRYNPELIEATAKSLTKDTDLTRNIAKIVGMSDYQSDSLSNTARAYVADQWLRGKSYDPVIDSGRDFEQEAYDWIVDRDAAHNDDD